jgi:glycerophosphoryl diester phosphodiesterase
MVYGGGNAVQEVRERLPLIKTIWASRLRQCLIKYAGLGWSGYVPADCRNSVLMVPANYAPWLWGWPNRFLQRMKDAGSRVFIIGDYHGEGYSKGFDDPDQLSELSDDYSGGIWTDRIDLIGPVVRK